MSSTIKYYFKKIVYSGSSIPTRYFYNLKGQDIEIAEKRYKQAVKNSISVGKWTLKGKKSKNYPNIYFRYLTFNKK